MNSKTKIRIRGGATTTAFFKNSAAGGSANRPQGERVRSSVNPRGSSIGAREDGSTAAARSDVPVAPTRLAGTSEIRLFECADGTFSPASSLTTTEALEAYERGWLAVSDVADLSTESRAAVGVRFAQKTGLDFVRVGKVLRAVRRGAAVNAEIREVA